MSWNDEIKWENPTLDCWLFAIHPHLFYFLTWFAGRFPHNDPALVFLMRKHVVYLGLYVGQMMDQTLFSQSQTHSKRQQRKKTPIPIS